MKYEENASNPPCHVCPVRPLLWLTLSCPLQAALKKYQMEHKSKGESLEKCQAELKKLRRKSQGSKHPSKYGDKEMRVSSLTPPVLLPWFSGPVIFSPVCKENIALDALMQIFVVAHFLLGANQNRQLSLSLNSRRLAICSFCPSSWWSLGTTPEVL